MAKKIESDEDERARRPNPSSKRREMMVLRGGFEEHGTQNLKYVALLAEGEKQV
jgi:hypothetical protein